MKYLLKNSVGHISRSSIVGSQSSIFNILKNHYVLFLRSCIIFFIAVILVGKRWPKTSFYSHAIQLFTRKEREEKKQQSPKKMVNTMTSTMVDTYVLFEIWIIKIVKIHGSFSTQGHKITKC